MLEEISIENLGVIESARVELGPGLTVVTGETGAGKTMLLTGLSLLMGNKADAGAVRPGADQAVVEGSLGVPPGSRAAQVVDDAGGSVDDDGSVVVLRTVAAGGRSRAHVGGRTVPQAVLGELAEELVTVHGQADQLRLRSPARQRAALDTFAGPDHLAVLDAYRAAWTERSAAAAELAEIRGARAERAREAELLRLGLAEVERVDPREGEDDELDGLIGRLTHVEDLRAAAQVAHDALSGREEADAPEGAVALVEHAFRSLEGAGTQDAALRALAGRVHEASFALGDAAAELASYVQDLQADPAALETAHARRAELTGLARAHGGSVAEVLAWASRSGLRLLDLGDDDTRVDELAARVEELDAQVVELAAAVSAGRRDAATALADAVTGELAGLAMGGARLEVAVAPADAPGPSGADVVELLLVPHAGAPARPLGKGASGGELSRVMLAIEVALATRSHTDGPLPTFVFDEVDAGVGGRAAVEVGRRLAELGRVAQVLVVTHLPQVAAFADAHVVVVKRTTSATGAGPDGRGDGAGRGGDDDGEAPVTASGVRRVEGDERVRELARMLSGQEDSSTALQHATELLETSVVGR
ncbi:DNA repair protein RecN [Luteimicrobium subarcticum]|uniref:DNA repair protein RecN n=1 Tax=Luteimicrobium subarcticum TaxID=620910 RepID=A0A2M8WWJ2_9MICO|nr:DNA repair protein RecN [Luteimicrobium subarcticum]PJI95291.1 DNA replication and repair protein RecN [Luteimicrobium subarcticum]